MSPIKLRPRGGIWASVVIICVFTICMDALLLTDAYPDAEKGARLFVAIFSFIAAGVIAWIIKANPFISVNEDSITFNLLWKFTLKELEGITETNRKPFPMIPGWMDFEGGNMPVPLTTLRFKNGKIKTFFDDNYANSWHAKSFIKRVVLAGEQGAIFHDPQVKKRDLPSEAFRYYKGPQILSFRGMFIWAALLAVVISFLTVAISHNEELQTLCAVLILMSPLAILFFFVSSRSMNYFGMSENYLLVATHNIPWRKYLYSLSEIKEIFLETDNELHVVPLFWEGKRYPGPTLREKDWALLIKELEHKGIPITDRRIHMFW